jgi:hypothetical protein
MSRPDVWHRGAGLWGDRGLGRRLAACAVALSVLLAACAGDAPSPTDVSRASVASPIPSPSPTPSPTRPPALDACKPYELVARVTRWEAAAGHRIAHVRLTTTSPTCTIPAMAQPQLVEHHGIAIIDGQPPAASPLVAIGPGDSLSTLVQADNYCGPVPGAPVTVAFVMTGVGRIVALPVGLTDTAGIPPCLGAEGSLGHIEMHQWAPSGSSASAAVESPSARPLATASPAAGPTAAACKPTDQDKYVWGPDRLAVQAPCIRVTGTVEAIGPEADGDIHILLALDPASRWLLTPANQGEMLGDLVVEPVCVNSVSPTQEAAEGLCPSDPDPFRGPFPAVGDAVWMEGRYVLDLQHGAWAELHPLYRWGHR